MKSHWLISLSVVVLLLHYAPALRAEENPVASSAGNTSISIRRASKTKSSRTGTYNARTKKGASQNQTNHSGNTSSASYSSKRSAGGGKSTKGLYSTAPRQNEQGIALSLDMFYSYDDIDAKGVSTRILSNWTGGGSFSYYVAIGKGVDFRATLGSGYIHGDHPNKDDGTGKDHFWTIFGELDAGIEWYPWLDYGFYVYAGIGCMMNSVTYTYNKEPTKGAIKWLPVVPLEVGYTFDIDNNWRIGVHFGGHIGVIDTKECNFDGYPDNKTAKGVPNETPDGYLTLGITFTYRWGG